MTISLKIARLTYFVNMHACLPKTKWLITFFSLIFTGFTFWQRVAPTRREEIALGMIREFKLGGERWKGETEVVRGASFRISLLEYRLTAFIK